MNRRYATTPLATLLVTAGLYLATGPIGALAGLTTAAALVVLPRPLGVAYAQLVVAAFAPTTLDPGLLVAELGVLVAFLGVFDSVRRGLATTTGVAVLGALWLGWLWPATTPTLAAALLVVVAALALYAVHRYERVRLDLVHT